MQYELIHEQILTELFSSLENELNDLIITENQTINNVDKIDKKKQSLRDLYNKLIQHDPNLAKIKLPVIGKFTYENFRKLIYDSNTRERFLKELGFDTRYISQTKQKDIIKKILTGKLTYKEGALLLSNELYNFIQTLYNNRSNKKKQNLYKKLGLSLLIAVIVILVVSFFITVITTVLPSLLGISSQSVIVNAIAGFIIGVITSITINFISKIYMFLHAELGTTFYGYISLLTAVTGSIVLIKVSSLITLIFTIGIFLLWLIWELEVLMYAKIEHIYKKLHLDNYRKLIVLKTLKLNVTTRVIFYILEKLGNYLNTNIIDKLIDNIIKVEDSADKIVTKISTVLDSFYEKLKYALEKFTGKLQLN